MRTDLLSRIPCRPLAAAAALLAATLAHAQPLVAPGDPAAATTTATPAPTPAPPMAAPPAAQDPAAAATVAPPSAPAAAAAGPARPPRRVKFVANAGYDYGFEEILTAEFEDGRDDRLPANGGGVLSLGAAWLPLASGALELRATIGVKYAAISASNGSVSYMAFPLELLAGWNIQRVRLSAGGSLSLSPRVRGDEFFEGVDFDMKNSLGLVGQIDYVFPFRGASGSFSVGLRFLLQRLEAKGPGSTGAHDANALGVVAGVLL